MSVAVRSMEDVPSQTTGAVKVKYFGWFDWLRFVLAGAILLYHEGILPWGAAGNFAVQVFFALSGWLIGGALCETERSGLKRFYFNRSLRIWCPYLLALSFLVAASLLHDHVTRKWVEIVFYQTTFVYNLFGTPQLAHFRGFMPLQGTGNHLWSVNAEEQFYLLAPVLLVILPRKIGRSVITWGILAALALVTHIYASIVFGVLAAVCAHNFGTFTESRWCRLITLLAASITAEALVAGAKYELVAPFCAVAIVLFFAFHSAPTRIGKFAGGMSYPLYLNAWIPGIAVGVACKHLHITNRYVTSFLIASAALALSALLYMQFDRRILSMRKRLYTPQRATVATYTAYGVSILGCVVGLVLQYLH